VAQAIANAKTYGWEPVLGAHVLAKQGYLAGNDVQRAADLNWALRDDSIDALWCIRGGYGVTRILDDVAYDAMQRRAKAVMGYSDITALHCAIGVRCGTVTYHAPTARAVITPFTHASFARAIIHQSDPCGVAPNARVIRPGSTHGRIVGGNLALLSALCGTPYAPDLRDAILMLEDINETVYRVDRMLQQLYSAGMLANIAAIAFGECTGCEGGSEDSAEERTLDMVLTELANRLDVPCLAGLPIGHIADQWTLPLGALATLDTERRELAVVV
jgi:muramoyltetrapeptide carboxypeptidase